MEVQSVLLGSSLPVHPTASRVRRLLAVWWMRGPVIVVVVGLHCGVGICPCYKEDIEGASGIEGRVEVEGGCGVELYR